jgi:hypothetical protein
MILRFRCIAKSAAPSEEGDNLHYQPKRLCRFAPERDNLDCVLVSAHEGGGFICDRIGCAQQHGVCGMYVPGRDRAALMPDKGTDGQLGIAEISGQ